MTDLQAAYVVAIVAMIGYAAGRAVEALVCSVWAGRRWF